jgi:hypothetical protein
MIDTQQRQIESPRRRRWIMLLVIAAVAALGIGVGFALADRDDGSVQVEAARAQLAGVNRGCTAWMGDTSRWGPTSDTWCDEMAGWMGRHMSNGSMTASMMWRDRDQMRDTCRSWMTTNPSTEQRQDWCDAMVQGMGPYFNDWLDKSTYGPMMGR